MTSFEPIELSASGLAFAGEAAGDGPVALCLHGFPDCLRSFRRQLPAFAEAGYRGVSVAMRGYAPTSQPGPEVRHYHPMRLAADVIAFAEALGPVHVIGHDWGAVVTYLAIAQRPELFRSATTIAVPHTGALRAPEARGILPAQLRKSWYMLFFQLRGLADRVVERRDFAFIERLWRDWSPGFEWDPAQMEAVKETFRQPGVRRSALAYYRAMFDPRLPDSRALRELGDAPIAVPTLAITGALDGCLDTRLYDHMPEGLFEGGLRVDRIEDAGHFVHQERPARTNAAILEWMAAHPEPSR